MADATGTQALFDLWKKQLDEVTQAWTRMMGPGQAAAPAPDLAQFWRPFLDQGMAAWGGVFTQAPMTPDLLARWKEFLDQWIAAWGKVLEQAMGTEAFAQALGKYLEQWLAAQGPARKVQEEAAEATLAALGLPSRAQVVGIARQLRGLEDRIEGLEDRLASLNTLVDGLRGLLELEKLKAGGGQP